MARTSLLEKREQLQTATLKVIAREGIDATSTRAITLEAGQNLAAINYAFESKDDLLLSVQEHLQSQVVTVLKAAIETCDSIESAIEAMARAYFDYTIEDPEKQRAHYELTLFALSKPAYASVAKQQYEQYIDGLVDILRPLGSSALGEPSWRAFAATCLAIMDGVILQYLATKDLHAVQHALNIGVSAIQLQFRIMQGDQHV